MNTPADDIKSKRRQKRLERADIVCRELRYLITHPSENWSKLYDLLQSWMAAAGKDKYKRP